MQQLSAGMSGTAKLRNVTNTMLPALAHAHMIQSWLHPPHVTHHHRVPSHNKTSNASVHSHAHPADVAIRVVQEHSSLPTTGGFSLSSTVHNNAWCSVSSHCSLSPNTPALVHPAGLLPSA